MIAKKYQRKNNSWWKNQRVVNLTEIRTYIRSVSPGVVLTVTRKYNGLHLETKRCCHCGLSFCVRNVRYTDLVLLNDVLFLGKAEAIRVAVEKEQAIVLWESKYIVLPKSVAVRSPYPSVAIPFCEQCGKTGETFDYDGAELCLECLRKCEDAEEEERRTDPNNYCANCGDYSEILERGKCPACFEALGYV